MVRAFPNVQRPRAILSIIADGLQDGPEGWGNGAPQEEGDTLHKSKEHGLGAPLQECPSPRSFLGSEPWDARKSQQPNYPGLCSYLCAFLSALLQDQI